MPNGFLWEWPKFRVLLYLERLYPGIWNGIIMGGGLYVNWLRSSMVVRLFGRLYILLSWRHNYWMKIAYKKFPEIKKKNGF